MTSSDTSAPTAAPERPGVVTAIAVLALLGAVGAAVMVVAHLALDMTALAAGFAVGTVAYLLLALGTWRRRAWAWPLGLVVNAIGLAAALLPWRGLDRSGLPTLVSLVALGLLLSRPGRNALLYAED